MLSRRTNLNTVRKDFCWPSEWTNNYHYTKWMLIDIHIHEYLVGLFYALKVASSYYMIRRFVGSFAIIETDVWVFDLNRITGTIIDSRPIFLFVFGKVLRFYDKFMTADAYTHRLLIGLHPYMYHQVQHPFFLCSNFSTLFYKTYYSISVPVDDDDSSPSEHVSLLSESLHFSNVSRVRFRLSFDLRHRIRNAYKPKLADIVF
jgi:hypothetical protein